MHILHYSLNPLTNATHAPAYYTLYSTHIHAHTHTRVHTIYSCHAHTSSIMVGPQVLLQGIVAWVVLETSGSWAGYNTNWFSGHASLCMWCGHLKSHLFLIRWAGYNTNWFSGHASLCMWCGHLKSHLFLS